MIRVRPEITFGKLIDAYIAVRSEDNGERTCRVIVRHVKLVLSENGNQPDVKVVGNLVVFYNQSYVPKMKEYFLGSRSLKQSVTIYQKRLAKDRKAASKERKQKIPEKKSADSSTGKSATATTTNNIARSSDSRENSSDKKSINKSLLGKDGTQVSSVEKAGSRFKGNSVTINSSSAETKTASNKSNTSFLVEKNDSTVSKVNEVSVTGKVDAGNISVSTSLVGKPLPNNSKQPVSAKCSASGSVNNPAFTEKLAVSNGVSTDLKKQSEKDPLLEEEKNDTLGEKLTIAVSEKSSSSQPSIEDLRKSDEKEDKMELDDLHDGKVDQLEVEVLDGSSTSLGVKVGIEDKPVDGNATTDEKKDKTEQTTECLQKRKSAIIGETNTLEASS